MALIYHESMRFPRMVMIPSIFIIHSYISLALEAFILVGVFVTHDLLRPSSHGGFINPAVTHSRVSWYRFVHWPEHQDQARDYWLLMISHDLCCTLLHFAMSGSRLLLTHWPPHSCLLRHFGCQQSPQGTLTKAFPNKGANLIVDWCWLHFWIASFLGCFLLSACHCFLSRFILSWFSMFPHKAKNQKPRARSKNQKQKAESQQPPRSSKATATRKKQKSTKSQKLRPNKRPLCKVVRLTLTKPSKQAKKSLYT